MYNWFFRTASFISWTILRIVPCISYLSSSSNCSICHRNSLAWIQIVSNLLSKLLAIRAANMSSYGAYLPKHVDGAAWNMLGQVSLIGVLSYLVPKLRVIRTTKLLRISIQPCSLTQLNERRWMCQCVYVHFISWLVWMDGVGAVIIVIF